MEGWRDWLAQLTPPTRVQVGSALGMLLLVAGGLDLLVQRHRLAQLGALHRQLQEETTIRRVALQTVVEPESADAASAVMQALPVDEQLGEVLAALTVSAERAGLELMQINRRSDRQQADHSILDFKVVARGRYEQFIRFLAHLQQTGRLIVVRQLALRHTRAPTNAAAHLEATCDVHAYRWLEPSPAQAAAGGAEAS